MQFRLQGLPANVTEVYVNDLRGLTSERDGVPQVLKDQLVNSLSAQLAPAEAQKYRLVIDLIEHRAFFTIGNWNAATRLRARLSDINGKPLGQWEVSGTAHRSNMFGYATAQAVEQDSYNIAVADLLSSLSAVSVR